MKRTLAILITTIMLFSLTGCDMLDYYKAGKLMDDGEYEDAYEMFEELGSYKDSEDLANECLYCVADEYLESGKYSKAYKLFIKLEDYEDAEDKANRCKYMEAEELFDSGDIDGAYEIFVALGSYEDSESRACECIYCQAEELFNAGDYEGAYDIYMSIAAYSDALDMAYECIYIQGKELFENGDLESAVEYFEQIPGYKDADDMVAVYNSIIDPEEFNATVVKYFKADLDSDITISGSGDTYKIKLGSTGLGTLEYSHVNESGTAVSGYTNHVHYEISMPTSYISDDDTLEAYLVFYYAISTEVMRSVDDSMDMETALGYVQDNFSKALSSMTSTSGYRTFAVNGVEYEVGISVSGSYVYFTIDATIPGLY